MHLRENLRQSERTNPDPNRTKSYLLHKSKTCLCKFINSFLCANNFGESIKRFFCIMLDDFVLRINVLPHFPGDPCPDGLIRSSKSCRKCSKSKKYQVKIQIVITRIMEISPFAGGALFHLCVCVWCVQTGTCLFSSHSNLKNVQYHRRSERLNSLRSAARCDLFMVMQFRVNRFGCSQCGTEAPASSKTANILNAFPCCASQWLDQARHKVIWRALMRICGFHGQLTFPAL